MKYFKLDEETKQQVYLEYLGSRLSYSDLSKKYNACEKTIYNIIKKISSQETKKIPPKFEKVTEIKEPIKYVAEPPMRKTSSRKHPEHEMWACTVPIRSGNSPESQELKKKKPIKWDPVKFGLRPEKK